MRSHVLDSIAQALDDGRDADDLLRSTVSALVEEPGVAWAAIDFLEDGELLRGPSAGDEDETHRRRLPISYRGEPVGELLVDGDADPVLLERVAALVAVHVLIGWDTGGEDWVP